MFLARDTRDGRQVAIKLLDPDLADHPEARRLFLAEARHVQRLQHSNILPVLDVCDREPCPYFVMPYMPRGTLASLIAETGPLDPPVILSIARDIAGAVDYAHARGPIFHRDLKPSNILLDHAQTAFLADFGLARRFDINDSLVNVSGGQTCGTPAYMAPEVASNRAGDSRADIYSFGCVMYEMLTGSPPYTGTTPHEVLEQVRNGPAVPVSKLNPKCDSKLARIAAGAMARDLRDRYSCMADVCRDLDRVRQGLKPIGPNGRTTRILGAVVSVAVGILGLAVAAVVYGTTHGPSRVLPEVPPAQPCVLNVASVQHGAMASADSIASYRGYVGLPEKAIDGNLAMGWRGENIPGWLEICLDRVYQIRSVGVCPGSHQMTYSISLSTDGSAWTTVVAPRQSLNAEGQDGTMERFSIRETPAKYLRIDITATEAPPQDIFQASVNELEALAGAMRMEKTSK